MQADSRLRLIHWSQAGSCCRLHLSLPCRQGVQLSCDRARFCLRWCCPLVSGLDVVEVVVAVCSDIAGLVSVSAISARVDEAVRDDRVCRGIGPSEELNACVGGVYAYTFSALQSEDPWPMRGGGRIQDGKDQRLTSRPRPNGSPPRFRNLGDL